MFSASLDLLLPSSLSSIRASIDGVGAVFSNDSNSSLGAVLSDPADLVGEVAMINVTYHDWMQDWRGGKESVAYQTDRKGQERSEFAATIIVSTR